MNEMNEELIVEPGQGATPAGALNTEPSPKPQEQESVPYARFSETNKRAKDAEAKLAKYVADQEKAEKKRLEDEKQYQQLYQDEQKRVEELSGYKERYDKLREQVAERNKTRFEAIPEKLRTLVPKYDDPFQLEDWLVTNQEMLIEPKHIAPSLDGGAGTKTRVGSANADAPTPEQIREQATRHGINPKHLAQQYGVLLD